MMKKLERGRTAMGCEGGYEALQSMLKGEYTEESTGARTIRQTGGKDRHSKVFTARGPRDRRVRLSVATAIRFYDLQDRLGFEQPSKAVEWLLLHCQPSIQALPQLAALHPAVCVATIPQPPYADHQYKEHEPCKDEHSIHHQEQKSYIDVVMHQNREQNFHHYDSTTPHTLSLHKSPFPLCTDSHVQDSIEEDPPQYSNPSSSGASSDHPLSLSEVLQPLSCRVTLAEAIPIAANNMASSTGVVHQCSTSFTSPATIHMNKKHRMQYHLHNQDSHAMLAANGTNAANIGLSVGRSLGINNGLSSSVNYSSFCNAANFNSLVINDENALLMNNSLQGQMNEDMQPMMRLPSLAYKPNQYADYITQILLAAQANQHADDVQHAIQGACNQSGSRELDHVNGQAACTLSSMNDPIQQLVNYNKVALQQQVDELVCSNVYASPSPSESTSINTLAAAYSKAGGSNNMVNEEAANILYRPTWNPNSSGL